MTQSKFNRRTFTMAAAATTLAGMVPSIGVLAQETSFPNRPVRIVVAYSAGGGADIAARLIAKHLSDVLGTPVIVENRPGADGMIAGSEVARSEPDGHTLFLATAGPITYVPAVQLSKPPYDPLKDFAPITHFVSYTYVLAVHESVPAKTFGELVAYAKKNPGKLAYGASNATTHLALVQMAQTNDLDMIYVPYKGEPLALGDLREGRIQAMFVAPNILEQLEGKARPLAVLGEKRSDLVPGVPTFTEVGVSGIDILPWSGVFATGGTPAPIIERLSAALNTVFQQPDVQTRLNIAGSVLEGSTPADLGKLVESQLAIWKSAVKAANITTY